MKTGRLEAFSDGVLAIVITIMVLEMKAPEGYSVEALKPLLPIFLSYILSFIYIAVYWNNHHHLMLAVNFVNGEILWANLNLLFWISLFPFTTSWMGENYLERFPIALYGFILLMASFAFKILIYYIIKNEGKNSEVGRIYGNNKKINLSVFIYLLGILLSFILPLLGVFTYLLVAILWFVPEKKIEYLYKN